MGMLQRIKRLVLGPVKEAKKNGLIMEAGVSILGGGGELRK